MDFCLFKAETGHDLNPANPLLIDTPFTNWQLDGLPSYRVEQIREWIFEKGILAFKDMTNLPGGLRQELAEKYDLTPMETAREQGLSRHNTKISLEVEG